MSTQHSLYGFTADEVRVLRDLAIAVQKSKQNVGTRIKDLADSAAKITEGVRTIPARAKGLEPHEVCLYCGTVGKAKERPKSRRPVCDVCTQPFTRKTPWRLIRGKRRHKACIQ